MQSKIFVRIRRWLTTAAIVLATALGGAIPAQARPGELIGYSVEGHELTPAEGNQYKYALQTMREGIDALRRMNWPLAKRNCESALETMYNLRMPERGTIAEVYMLGRACVADTQIATQNYERGCRTFSRIGYYRSNLIDTQKTCLANWQSDEKKLLTHSDYNRAFARFAGLLIELNDLPAGASRDSKIVQMKESCPALEQFGTTIAPAPGAVAYCYGASAMAKNDFRTGCRHMWSGAGYLATAMSRQMFDEQRSHGKELQAMIAGYRSVCADAGYRWPEFGAAWPH